MRRSVIPVLAGLLVFATVAVACGGGSSKLKATDFADKTCNDFEAFGKSVRDVVTSFKDVGSLTTVDATTLKQLSSALGTLDGAIGKLVSGINGRAAPDVKNGDQIKKDMIDALNKMKSATASLRTKLNTFNPDTADDADSSSLSSAFDSFGSAFESEGSNFSNAFSDNSDLSSAASGSSKCQQVNSEFSDLSS